MPLDDNGEFNVGQQEQHLSAAGDDQGRKFGEVVRQGSTRAEWTVLFILLGIAIVLRFGFIPDIGQRGDFEAYSAWIDNIRGVGLFNFYDPGLRFDIADRTYPALATYSFGALGLLRNTFPATFDDRSHPATYIALLKLFPVGCDLATLVVIFCWLRT